ncbi:SnaRE protein [Cardiosporidium cionae]|uniref:SnaRE protein n=1 Tax=Cardiosporidium cionae TaxID=476202 RepID=A0ABQ7J5X4_9APIC|nr:SnaRE protein [Cardiosporidium cionae]|eukprot:KAF8819392.1 SnaRE protein [Cardiosporidium cionae]
MSGSSATDKSSSPVRLLSLVLYKWSSTEPIQLAAIMDLSSFPFFYRAQVKEHVLFGSKLIAARTHLGGRQVVEFEQNIGKCHVYVHPCGLCATAISSPSYPLRVAFGFVSQAIQNFNEMYQGQWEKISQDMPEGDMFAAAGKTLLATYQNPTEADKILKVQKDLDEVKDVMLKNIDELLQRGESLDALMQKSENLSSSAYQLYRQGKRANQCCKWY